jgi:chromosome segregation ATPase
MDNLVDNQEDYQDLTVREYAQHFGLPEQTVRSRISAGKLTVVDIVREGKTLQGIRVSLSKLHSGNDDNQGESQTVIRSLSSDKQAIFRELSPIIRPDYQMIIDNNEARIRELKDLIMKLESDNHNKTLKIDELSQKLADERARASRFEGELQSKAETISAMKSDLNSKDQAINAANAAVMLMEQQKKTLDVSAPKQIETALKKPWWRFGV